MAILGVNGNFSDYLLVDPGVMKTKAEIIQMKIKVMQEAFDELETTMGRTKAYWEGIGGDVHRGFFNEKKTDVEMIFRRLKENVTDLHTMASEYVAGEQKAQEIAENLLSEAIL